MVQYLINNKELDTFKTILLVKLDGRTIKNFRTLSDVTNELDLSESKLKSKLEDPGDRTLIIFDGVDELTKNENWGTSFWGKMMSENEFPSAIKLLLSRPCGVRHIQRHVKVDKHLYMAGVSDIDISHILGGGRVVTLCDQYPKLLQLVHKIPLFASLLRQFAERRREYKVTDVYIHFVTEVIKRRLVQRSYAFDENLTISILPEEIHEEFLKLCKFAFHSLMSSHLLGTSEQRERFLSTFYLCYSFSLIHSETFDLVEEISALDNPDLLSFQFIDPVIREFLAAFYLQSRPPLDQLELLHKHTFDLTSQPEPTYQWLIFFFGLCWRREMDFDPTKFMISTLLEFLVHCLIDLHTAGRETCDNTPMFSLLLCIAETKDDDLWKKFASNLGGNIFLQVSVGDLKQHMLTIANMMSRSGIREWSMIASDFNASQELKSFELYVGGSVSKAVLPDLGDSVRIFPTVSPDVASRRRREFEKITESADKDVAFMNHFHCRAIREVLQRVLKVYSDIKLKGDASNPAYVSFLSCDCFKRKMQDNIQFEPCIPHHFLAVTSQNTLRKIREENRVHMAEHGDAAAVELVILLKPCLRKVTITVPQTLQKYDIVFVSEEMAHKVVGEGAISSSFSSSGSSQEALNICVMETAPTSSSEMVRPCLPLPNRPEHSTRATTVLPQMSTPGTIAATVAMQYQSTMPETELIQHRQPQHQVDLPDSPRSGKENVKKESSGSAAFQFPPPFSSLNPHTVTTVTPERQQTVALAPSQQQAVLSRANIKEGAVLFTSVPTQIPSDRIHPLPDESHQMRRGGNGQIFRGTICGVNVVYKKTNYRSKEYSIITKVKHKNIVQLLAFMYGAENPEHRRRHFCYHIMPQLSGDCARMLTDKEELTIKELSKRHGNDIRRMGIIRGNLKYLLKEVLGGLRYLHSLRIVHRDVKGSNILLNFTCSCTNPLECGCDPKYQVQLCDFDAGVELDENECLPLSQIRFKHTMPYVHYICVPVGTDGFRSPECSMLAIANSSDAFSPPITTRADIWSLGILTIRILIGVNGPRKQREMALLLLSYHRQRFMHEGLIKQDKPQFLEVDRLVTDKLLNVSPTPK